MPEISRFPGIVIGIFPREHPPPHFHAVYGDYQITVEIKTGIIKGNFPKRALRHVLEWLDLHQDELLSNWHTIQKGYLPKKNCTIGVKNMIPQVIEATYAHDYVIHLIFADGTEGDVDLAQELYGKLFEPLKNIETFKQFIIHLDFHTLCWPNGADFAPEFLYEKSRIPA